MQQRKLRLSRSGAFGGLGASTMSAWVLVPSSLTLSSLSSFHFA